MMTTLREAAQAVLDRWDSPKWEWHQGPTAALMADLRAALAEPVQEPERKPLHDMAVFDLADALLYGGTNYGVLAFARAIERHHGIK